MTFLEKIKSRSAKLKSEAYAVYLAARHPETPWYVKLLIFGITAYAFSPIDLIPDFIPVLGYLDDIILIPLGITLAVKLIPDSVMQQCREKAAQQSNKPKSLLGAALVIILWIAGTALFVWLFFILHKSL